MHLTTHSSSQMLVILLFLLLINSSSSTPAVRTARFPRLIEEPLKKRLLDSRGLGELLNPPLVTMLDVLENHSLDRLIRRGSCWRRGISATRYNRRVLRLTNSSTEANSSQHHLPRFLLPCVDHNDRNEGIDEDLASFQVSLICTYNSSMVTTLGLLACLVYPTLE